MDRREVIGLTVATAVVSILAASSALADPDDKAATSDERIKCYGINACKGSGDCAAPDGDYSCAGKNACKGKGWVLVLNQQECDAKGGKVFIETPSPVPDRPPGEQVTGYYRTMVWFATDRLLETKDNGTTSFRNERGDGSLNYGVVSVSIPDAHFTGEIESPSWWHILGREDPSKYVLVLSIDTFRNSAAFSENVKTLFDKGASRDVMLFIHGYSVSFEEAAQRTAQLAYDLKFKGAPMFFSWASRGDPSAYPADTETVMWTREHLQSFLKFVSRDLGARNVHIIAHSMGNRALAEALNNINPSEFPSGSARISQIILAAPDIDVGVFRQLAATFPGKAERITLYTSRNDRVLQLSVGFNDFPRVGNSVVVFPGIDTIDASTVDTDFYGHSYFGKSIVSDIYAIVSQGLAPGERFGLVRKHLGDGQYWEFVSGAH